MIVYIKQTENIEFMHKILNIFRIEKEEDKVVIYLPINKNTRKRKIEKVFEKLSKYFYNNNIKDVVLEQELMQNKEAKNILYSNNINILNGSKLSRFLVYNVIEKIYEYKRKKIEAGEVTFLVNENDDVNIQTIAMIAQNIKRINIITNSTKKFKKVVEYLYDELGILIKLSNNIKTNLNNSDIIVNMDFSQELINKLEIPTNGIILNIPNNININSKKFSGINIKSWQIEVPSQYKLDGYDEKIVYEASLYRKPVIKIFEQIQEENVKIKHLVGMNGIINPKEFG